MVNMNHIVRAAIFLRIISGVFCVRSLTTTDVDTFHVQVSGNLTRAIHRWRSDILQPDNVAALFEFVGGRGAVGTTQPLKEVDVRRMLSELVGQVESKYNTVESALVELRNKLQAFLQSSNTHRSGRPHLVQSCCKPRPPSLNNVSIKAKLGVPVDTTDVCYARDEATAGNGFNLWADDVMDTMKTNFESLPGVLWQEFVLERGLHVQFPSASRSCMTRDTSSSKLLRPWFRERLQRGPVNLVVILDAGDSMTNKVFRPGSNLSPMTHWDIVKNAATELVGTLMPWDKANVVSTGGRKVSVPLGCDGSMFDGKDSNIDDMARYMQSVVPKGTPDYQSAFRQAFSLLVDQQAKDQTSSSSSGQHHPRPSNVILFLTNGDNVVTDDHRLLQTIKDGQSSLPNNLSKAHIQVYAIQQVFIPSLSTWLQVADQNNRKLAVFDGNRNMSAEAWNLNPTTTSPQGPPGYLEITEDIEGYKLANSIRKFHDRISIPFHSQSVVSFIQGGVLQLVSPLPNTRHPQQQTFADDGVVSLNASLQHVFDDVTSFSFGRHSYAFVVDVVTGDVIYHPKMRKVGASALTWNNLFPNLPSAILDNIRASTDQGTLSSVKMVQTGRELFRRGMSGSEEEAFLAHRLVKGTRFVVGLVTFKSEFKTNPVSAGHTLQASGKTVYHRFDLLPNSVAPCDRDGVQATLDEDVIGIKFSPDVSVDSLKAAHNQDTLPSALEMDRFIQQGDYPNSFKPACKDGLQLDLSVVKSKRLQTIWSDNSSVEPTQRYIGTKTGIVAVQPTSPLLSLVDYKDREWYWQAITRLNTTVITKETLPGQHSQIIISTAIHTRHRIYGVVAASIPVDLLHAMFFSEVPLCQRQELACELLDNRGCVIDLWSMSVSSPSCKDNHVTHKYPWLANELLSRNVLKASWSYSLAPNRMYLQYTLNVPTGSPGYSSASTSTPECRRFALYPIEGSNLSILLLADRGKVNCPPESVSSGESCTVSTASKPTSSSSLTFPTGPHTPPPLNNGPPTPPPLNNGPHTPPPLNNGPHTPPPLNNGPQTPPPLNNSPHTPPPLNNGPQTPPPLNNGPHTPPPLNNGPHTPPPSNNSPHTPPPLNNGPQTPPPLNNGPQTPPPLNNDPHTPPPLNNNNNNNPKTTKSPPAPNNAPPTPPPLSPISQLSSNPPLPHSTGPQAPPPLPPHFPGTSSMHAAPNQHTPSSFSFSLHQLPQNKNSRSQSHPPPTNPLSKTHPLPKPTSPLSIQPNTPSTQLKNNSSSLLQPQSHSSIFQQNHQIHRRANAFQTPPPLANKPRPQPSSPTSLYSSPSIPKCTHCPNTSPTPFLTPNPPCQVPCYCDTPIEECTKSIRSSGAHDFNIYHEPVPATNSPTAHRPDAGHLPLCPKRCSDVSNRIECDSNTTCEWNQVTNAMAICRKRRSLATTRTSASTSLPLSTSFPVSIAVAGGSAPVSSTAVNGHHSISDTDDDSSTADIAIGSSVGGVTLFLLLLVLAWKMSWTHKLFKPRQVKDSSDTLHDGKRYSKDGLIIHVQE